MDWDKARRVADEYGPKLMALPDVVGISTAVNRTTGEPRAGVKVYVRRPVARGSLDGGKVPAEIDGVPLEVVVTGDMVAFGNKET